MHEHRTSQNHELDSKQTTAKRKFSSFKTYSNASSITSHNSFRRETTINTTTMAALQKGKRQKKPTVDLYPRQQFTPKQHGQKLEHDISKKSLEANNIDKSLEKPNLSIKIIMPSNHISTAIPHKNNQLIRLSHLSSYVNFVQERVEKKYRRQRREYYPYLFNR